jgi:hypothetical protein
MRYRIFVRVLVAITFAMVSVGRSMAMIPDYSNAQQAALRIIRLDQRQSRINPHDESGMILVCIFVSTKLNLYLMFRMKL